MEITLDTKKVLITGGTRGIGRAIAMVFAEAGADLTLNFSKDDEAAEITAAGIRKLGRSVTLIKGNAADFAVAEKMVRQSVEAMGRIDILVNNAGISHNTPFMALEAEEWRGAIDVNLNSLFAVTQPVIKQMIIKKIPGKILNITSVCGVRPVAAVPVHYATTKAAMVGFTYTLAKEMGRYNIAVNGLAPGLIETAFSVNLPEVRKEDFKRFCPMGRIGTPEEVARMALFLVSDVNSYMTGETVIISGGL